MDKLSDDQLREKARETVKAMFSEQYYGSHEKRIFEALREVRDSRQPLSGVEEVLKVLEPFARLAAQCQRVGLKTSSHVQAAADLHARLSAQAGGEKETGELCPRCGSRRNVFMVGSGGKRCTTCYEKEQDGERPL